MTTKPFEFEAFALENACREFNQTDRSADDTSRIRSSDEECIGSKHWWFYALPTVLKCKRCGAVKYAPK